MRKAMLVLFAFGIAGSLLAADQTGTWKLNIDKSKLPPSAANLKESIMVFREIDANTIEGSARQTLKDGKTTTGKWTTAKSGGIQTYQEGAPANGISSVAAVIDTDTIYQIYLQNGKQIGLMRVDFSKDGKTFTISGKGADAQGKPVEYIRLFEKQ
jgi:hypothetical protein